MLKVGRASRQVAVKIRRNTKRNTPWWEIAGKVAVRTVRMTKRHPHRKRKNNKS